MTIVALLIALLAKSPDPSSRNALSRSSTLALAGGDPPECPAQYAGRDVVASWLTLNPKP